MHRSDYRLFPELRLICIIYSGDIDGAEIAEHVGKIIHSGKVDHSWNCLVDLRSFVGDIHHSSLELMARLLNKKQDSGSIIQGSDKIGSRVAIVSYNAGLKFMINLARVYMRGYDLRYFADMRQGFSWASGRDFLPPEMRSLDWHLVGTQADAGDGPGD
ncbi:hypothetical protein [Azospirillum sp. B4]|uniref:hypothetical protein n=1 Tax=Azospirillum sp. B4 TaxID=95605 RepID=UPI0011DDA67E|nr:hypothetical protein [Azospirillum sp. B4]